MCSRVQGVLGSTCRMLARGARRATLSRTPGQHCLISLAACGRALPLQGLNSTLCLRSVLSRQLSSCNLSLPRNILAAHAQIRCNAFMFSPSCSALRGSLGLLPVMQARTVVKHSKLGKMKTVKAVAKRFRRTGSGKLKFWPPGNVHNLLSKSHSRKRRIRKARYANKTQSKTLNKMLIGRWS